MEKFKIIWNRYDDKFKCVIGYLEYNDIWRFYYDKEGIGVASKLGFVLFPEFPDIDTVYDNPELFQTFDIRIRRSHTNVPEEEKIKLLKSTKGILVTDNIIIEKDPTLVKVK